MFDDWVLVMINVFFGDDVEGMRYVGGGDRIGVVVGGVVDILIIVLVGVIIVELDILDFLEIFLIFFVIICYFNCIL